MLPEPVLEKGSGEEPRRHHPSCRSARGLWSTSNLAQTTALTTLRLESLDPQDDGAMQRAKTEMVVTTFAVAEDSKLRLLWSMRSVIASLFGVARFSASNAEEENFTTLVAKQNQSYGHKKHHNKQTLIESHPTKSLTSQMKKIKTVLLL